MIMLTAEQSKELQDAAACPVVVSANSKEYLLVPSEYREIIERILNPAEVDESFIKCEDVPESK
jgi:hypothetical protein